jgi:hypothetical protein
VLKSGMHGFSMVRNIEDSSRQAAGNALATLVQTSGAGLWGISILIMAILQTGIQQRRFHAIRERSVLLKIHSIHSGPGSTFPSSEWPPLINLMFEQNEGLPHHRSTLPLTHKAKSHIVQA